MNKIQNILIKCYIWEWQAKSAMSTHASVWIMHS